MGNTPTPLRRTVRYSDVAEAEKLFSQTKDGGSKLINDDYSPDCILEACTRVQGNALYYAVLKNKEEMVELFLRHGGDIYSTGRYDETVLHCCARCYGNVKIGELLISHGSDLHTTDDLGRSPIHSACMNKWFDSSDFIHLLLSKLATPEQRKEYLNSKDFNGFTPILTAVDTGNVRIVKTLLELEVDLNVTTQNGSSVYDFAQDCPNILKVLPPKPE